MPVTKSDAVAKIEQYLRHTNPVLPKASVADLPVRIGTQFRVPEFTHCCALPRASGHRRWRVVGRGCVAPGYAICHAYESWLRDERGLATASIDALDVGGKAIPYLAA